MIFNFSKKKKHEENDNFVKYQKVLIARQKGIDEKIKVENLKGMLLIGNKMKMLQHLLAMLFLSVAEINATKMKAKN